MRHISARTLPPYWTVLAAASLSAMLFTLAHAPLASHLWALLALTPLLIVARAQISVPQLLIAAVVSAIGPTLVMYESVVRIAPGALIAGAVLHAVQLFFPLMAWRLCQGNGGFYRSTAAMTASWLAVEQIRSQPILNHNLASFYSLAYTQGEEASLFILASVGGAPLVVLAILTINSLVAYFIRTRMIWPVAAIAAILTFPLVLSGQATPEEATEHSLKIASIQPAWSSFQYWLLGSDGELATELYVELVGLLDTVSPDADLVALPETIIRTPRGIEALQHRLTTRKMQDVFTGIAHSDDDLISNSIVHITADDADVIYNKWQLVPLYETPIFDSGGFAATFTSARGNTYGFVICMDGTFEWLLKQTILSGAEAIILISSTDYGFGYWTPELQLRIAKFHAATFHIPVLFVASIGPTALVGTDGTTVAALRQGVQGVLEATVPIPTPRLVSGTSSLWRTLGLSPILALSLLSGLRKRSPAKVRTVNLIRTRS